MAEVLIHIGDGKNNSWKDGDIVAVRLQDGTFSPAEHKLPFQVIPITNISRELIQEFNESGTIEHVIGRELKDQYLDTSRRSKYQVDWRANIPVDKTEQDVLSGEKIYWVRKPISEIANIRR